MNFIWTKIPCFGFWCRISEWSLEECWLTNAVAVSLKRRILRSLSRKLVWILSVDRNWIFATKLYFFFFSLHFWMRQESTMNPFLLLSSGNKRAGDNLWVAWGKMFFILLDLLPKAVCFIKSNQLWIGCMCMWRSHSYPQAPSVNLSCIRRT